MLVQHYAQLLAHHRRAIVAVVLGTTALAAALSAVRLFVSPRYTAAASVVVLPTEAEYSFGRDSATGPRGTARSLVATYIEYLRSRPVVEAALDKIGAGRLASAGTSSAPPGALGRLARQVRGAARRIYHTLDSGRYVPIEPREAALRTLMDAIRLETVADSYILRVEVTLEDPATAAAAANALAEAYVERVSAQLATSVGQIGGFLQEQIGLRETEMQALRNREDSLKAGVGGASIEAERDSLMRARETERQKLLDAQTEQQAAAAELDMLMNQDTAVSGRSLTDLAEARSAAAARRDAAQQNVELRTRTLRDLNATLEALRSKEEPLLSVQRRLETVKTELDELNARMLSTNLTRSSALTQVRVVDPAVVPAYPSAPRVVRNTAVGSIAGAIASLMLVMLVDMVSSALKTTVDLERVVGPRAVGRIPRRLGRDADRAPGRKSEARRRSLAALGEDLERRLALLGAFDAGAVPVTGFVDRTRLESAAGIVGRALATRAGNPGGHEPEVAVLPPISSELRLGQVAERSRAVLCVVPAGEIAERDVKEFHDRALAAGLSAVSFVLLEC